MTARHFAGTTIAAHPFQWYASLTLFAAAVCLPMVGKADGIVRTYIVG